MMITPLAQKVANKRLWLAHLGGYPREVRAGRPITQAPKGQDGHRVSGGASGRRHAGNTLRSGVPRLTVAAFGIAIVALLAGAPFVAFPATASADAECNYGICGTTYQVYYETTCKWYDIAHDNMSDKHCYKGVSSDTTNNTGMAEVDEYAMRQTWDYAGGGSGTVYEVYYAFFGSQPSYYRTSFFASTSHYYTGDFGGVWPVNVIGLAYHYGDSLSQWVNTQALWGDEYIEP
jgi:hypothetical protein